MVVTQSRFPKYFFVFCAAFYDVLVIVSGDQCQHLSMPLTQHHTQQKSKTDMYESRYGAVSKFLIVVSRVISTIGWHLLRFGRWILTAGGCLGWQWQWGWGV